MDRKAFLFLFFAFFFLAGANKRFRFKIKTEDGSIIGNIVITGTSLDNAKFKLMQRYPKCQILDSKELD